MMMRCCSVGKSVWEPLVIGKWTPGELGREWHPSRSWKIEKKHATVMVEPVRDRLFTVREYNK
jgi:hypothetical protein